MKLKVERPSSFFTSDSEVKILDDKGNIFYVHPNRQRKICFNLPIGEYETENNLKEVGFVPYVKTSYPDLFQRIKKYKVIKKFNPNKASIFQGKKKIKISDKVKYADGSNFDLHEFKPCTVFLLGHEAAHTIVGSNTKDFDAETACDNISEAWMLANGYNPSQIKICKQLTLSSPERKHYCPYDSKEMNFRR